MKAIDYVLIGLFWMAVLFWGIYRVVRYAL